ncbi:MAG: hypothetical protein Ct9H300mP6_03590 [Gammaproteobacteria bacterium]|nr:MAG: hypothetical protein Ct9H300mP6_03590 [Gammaproteobacteria bacterium]
MPVVISLYNALTGLAVGFEGYVLQNYSMINFWHSGRGGWYIVNPINGKGHEPLTC